MESSRGRSSRRRVGEHGAEPALGVVVVAAQHVGDRDGGDEQHPPRDLLLRQQRDRRVERGAAVFEPAGGAERQPLPLQQRGAMRGVLLRRQLEGRAVPVGGGRRGGHGRLRAGRLEQRDRGRVAGPRELLDVVGTQRRRRPAPLQQRGCACMRLQPPGAVGRVGDRAVDERVAEAEGAAAGGAHEVGRDERVERRQRGRLGDVGGRGRDVELERVAGDGGAAREGALRGREALQLLRDRRGDGAGDRLVGVGGVAGAARQLAQEERVAVGLVEDPLAHGVVELRRQQPARRSAAERRRAQLVPAVGAAAGVDEPRADAARPQREQQQEAAARWAPQQVQQQLDRRLVGPLDVVEQQRQRLLLGELLQSRADRVVEAEALPRDHRLAGRGHRQRVEPLAQRRPQQPERQVLLLLGGAGAGDPHAGRGGPLGGGGEQRALADPGLAGDGQQPPAAALDVGEGTCDRRDLDVAPEQSHRGEG